MTGEIVPGLNWTQFVEKVKAGDELGLSTLHNFFSRGISYYLARQIGNEELEYKVDAALLAALKAIKRGELTEPEYLIDFVRNVVRRHLSSYVENAFEGSDEATKRKTALVRSVLEQLSEQDRTILVRFYLREESAEKISKDLSMTVEQFQRAKGRAKQKFGELGRKMLATESNVITGIPEALSVITPNLFAESFLNDARANVLMAVAAAFQDANEARRWLTTPSESFDKKPPISVIDSTDGRQKILNEVVMIEHGTF